MARDNESGFEASDAAELKSRMPDVDQIANLADVFGLLGDPSRLRILIALLPGPRKVHELSELSGLSQSATSHSLRLLRSHRVVNVNREGRIAHYEIADQHVRDFLELALQHVGHTSIVHAILGNRPLRPSEQVAHECQ
jgi:DNA-binding transcriptional ArsR family regulator